MWLTIVAVAAAYARTTIGPLQESLRVALALSDNEMALLQGPALALPMVVATVPLGLAIDRYSRARLLLVFAVVQFVGSLLTAFVSDFWLLFMGRCVVGAMVIASSTTSFSLLADLYAPEQRGRASMIIVIGQFAGMSTAFALGGALLAFIGPTETAWRSAMVWMSLPLLLAIVAAVVLREPARTGCERGLRSSRHSFVEAWHHRGVVAPLLVGLVMAEMAILAALTWATPALSRVFALPTERAGAIMATALLISGVAGPLAGGLLADFCQRIGGPRWTVLMLAALAASSVPVALFANASSVGTASVALTLFMTLVGAMVVAGTALFTIVVPNELRGLCLALLTTGTVIFGVALSPLLVSAISGFMGGSAHIGTALAAVCVSASLFSAGTLAAGFRLFPGGMRTPLREGAM